MQINKRRQGDKVYKEKENEWTTNQTIFSLDISTQKNISSLNHQSIWSV